jgi:hypothetical protein
MDALTESTPEMQIFAAAYLGEMGIKAEPAVPRLIQALDDQDPRVRAAAAVALGRIGPRAELAVPALIRRTRIPRLLSGQLLLEPWAGLVRLHLMDKRNSLKDFMTQTPLYKPPLAPHLTSWLCMLFAWMPNRFAKRKCKFLC